jgi:hypothetical protein
LVELYPSSQNPAFSTGQPQQLQHGVGGIRYLQLIIDEPKLQIFLIVSVQNLTSKNYRYCKHTSTLAAN